MPDILLRAQTSGTPLIDGNTAAFVWHGKHPPLLIGDFTDWEDGSPQVFTRQKRRLWTCSLTFPPDAYLEYAFVLDGERQPDPFNPRTTPNGLGKINHFFYMPDGSPTSLSLRDPSVPRGRVTRHVLHTETMELVIGRKRTVYLYQPPVNDPAPLVVVWDGVDYLRRADLPVILDNLIAQERIRPLALAMVQNAGRARSVEYGCNDATLGFLMMSILPLAGSNLRLTDPQQGNYGVLGASLGGLMALYTAMRISHIFSAVISQSGSLGSEDYDPVVNELIRHTPVKPVKIWMDAGTYDFPDIRASNRSVAALLQERGYTVAFRQFNAGHNYPAWRDDLWRGLVWLYGK